MSNRISRLRWLFATAAILVLVVVTGFYVYGRRRAAHLIDTTQKKLGVEVQQTTEGFSLSKSENGHTLYTIRAKNATRYKDGGRAELRDVNIVVYGHEGNRYDQIYGTNFEYDPQSGNIISHGIVHIDLQSAGDPGAHPDLSPPKEANNTVHVETSGLVFNQKTGRAETVERVDFRVEQTSGSAVGAYYDSQEKALTLVSDVHMHNDGPHPADVSARRGVITKQPRQVILDNARLVREAETMEANQAVISLRDDNTVDHIDGAGDVRMTSVQNGDQMVARAPQGQAVMAAKGNEISNAVLFGGVTLEESGAHPMNAEAGRVLLDFADAKLRNVHARENAKLIQLPPSTPTPNPQTVELDSENIDFHLTDQQELENAETSGPAKIVILDAGTAQQPATRTVVTAVRFDAAFAENRMKTLHGAPNARVVSSTPGEADRVSTSREITADFDDAGAMSKVVQQGDFEYHEALPKQGGERAAWAQKATYTPADQLLTLTGSPRMIEGGMTTTARTVRISRATGDAEADANVKTTYSDLKPQSDGALLASGDPIHVTARSMTAHRNSGIAHYVGEARLWQAANIVQAPIIDFDRDQRSMFAQGTPETPVKTVLVQRAEDQQPEVQQSGVQQSKAQQHGKSKPSPITVTAMTLTYADNQRLAQYDRDVIVRSTDGQMTCNHADVYLKPREADSSPQQAQLGNVPVTSHPSLPDPAGPSQLDRIVAEKNVVITQPNRRGTGQKLVYTADDGRFVLTGGPPMVWDADKGTSTGVSLTFWNRNDRVLVVGDTSKQAVTKTRVSK
jgi:lipopolysaccharide export system protein LptA